MMDFLLKEEERIFQANFKKFVDRKVKPLVSEAERKEQFPVELFPEMGGNGYLGITLPEEYGGGNAGLVSECLWEEEMARANVGISTSIGLGSTIAFYAINLFGDENQKERYLIPANRGRLIGAIAITEPNAGSDVGGIKTFAKKTAKGWILNGTKTWITNATIADVIVVVAYTDKEKGPKAGISLLIVEKGAPGLHARKLKKMCSKASDTGELILDNVEIPEQNLLGNEGMGLQNFTDAFLPGRVLNASRSLGAAESCFELAKRYSQERIQFGQPICKFQAIRFKLVAMAMGIELARNYIYYSARMHEAGRLSKKTSSIAKLYASELAQNVASEAMQIFGAYGISTEFEIERFFRDTRSMTVGEGTSEVHKMIIAHELKI
jgi:alkylation response protein AidB-like acyl-CoA dehydrogenase